jgi:DNA topoisomerase-3
MVAEKPSIAKSIAEALGNKVNTVKGFSKAVSVHQYFGEIFGKKAKFRVTSVTGHVFACDLPY